MSIVGPTTMPISFIIDHDKRRIYSRASGLVTYDDLDAHMNADVGPSVAAYSEVFDATGATTNLTAADVRLLATNRERIAVKQSPAPVAVVAPNDLFFGMFRIFDVLTEEVRPIRVFRRPDEAEQWLDSLSENPQHDKPSNISLDGR